MMKYVLFIAALAVMKLHGQVSFQKLYTNIDTNDILSDVVSLGDGGYAISGIRAGTSSTNFVARMDCEGNVMWMRQYGEAFSESDTPILKLSEDNQLILASNTFGPGGENPNILLCRIQLNGNLTWKRRVGGANSDLVKDMILTSDGKIVLTGSTNSIGLDQGVEGMTDVLLAKLDFEGNLEWNKSFGSESSSEHGNGLAENSDNGRLMLVGQRIAADSSAAQVVLTDPNGNFIWTRSLGVNNHFSSAFQCIYLTDGNWVIAGSSSIQNSDLNGPQDVILMLVDEESADLISIKAISPNEPGQSKPGDLIREPGGGRLLLAAQTEGYTSLNDGDTPSKIVVYRMNGLTNLDFASLYANGDSFNPTLAELSNAPGYLIGSQSGLYADGCCNWEALLIRTEGDLQSGCNQTDVLSATQFNEIDGLIWNSSSLIEDTGISAVSLSGSSSIAFDDVVTLCEQFPPFFVGFEPPSTCFGESVEFVAETEGNISLLEWEFDNGFSSEENQFEYTFTQPGDYEVSLYATDGCQQELITQVVSIYEEPEIEVGDELTINEGESVELGGNPTGEPNWTYLWDNELSLNNPESPNPLAFPDTTTTYTVTVTDPFGCFTSAEQQITVIQAPPPDVEVIVEGELFIPNIFSPNGDNLNDEFKVYGGPFPEFKLEVFNRLGERVFSSEDQDIGWDGYFNGDIAPSAVYYYQFQGKDINNLPANEAGNISLIR